MEFHNSGQKELKVSINTCADVRANTSLALLHMWPRSTFPSALMFVIKDRKVLLDGGNGSIHLSNRWDAAAAD